MNRKLSLSAKKKTAPPPSEAEKKARKYHYGKSVYIADDVHAALLECALASNNKRRIQHYASELLAEQLRVVRQGLVKDGLLQNTQKPKPRLRKSK